jgi:hypothetical protein
MPRLQGNARFAHARSLVDLEPHPMPRSVKESLHPPFNFRCLVSCSVESGFNRLVKSRGIHSRSGNGDRLFLGPENCFIEIPEGGRDRSLEKGSGHVSVVTALFGEGKDVKDDGTMGGKRARSLVVGITGLDPS